MKTTDVGLLVCWNAVSPPQKKKTNKCEVNVGECSFLLIGYGVFFIKSWHDAVQQPQGRQSPLIDNLFARSVLGCRLQLRLSSKEDGSGGVSTLDFIFHNINWKCFGFFFVVLHIFLFLCTKEHLAKTNCENFTSSSFTSGVCARKL